MKQLNLPEIAVEVTQPGDKGNFVVTVYDSQTQTRITRNVINEKLSTFEYIYTARMIEGGGLRSGTGNTDMLRDDRRADLARYGQRLYRDLFGKGDRFRKYLARQPHLQNGAQIVLKLHDTASELWNVPWEYMHDGECFLGAQPQYPILRNLKDAELKRSGLILKTMPKPLRMLFVISNPRDALPLNVDSEIEGVRAAVALAQSRGDLEIDIMADATLEKLEAALKQKSYHILHYSGHGAITPFGSCLVMESDEGLSRPVILPELLPIIESMKDLRVVFLSACKAGNITETTATSGVATGLMTVVPAVVAMQFSIRDDRAKHLARSFYQSIGQGDTITTALHKARRDLYKDDDTIGDWGVPTLYTHESELRLIDPRQLSHKKPVPKPKAPPKPFSSGLEVLPKGQPFIGRHEEQRQMRAALGNEKLSLLYLWGMSGYGKSALVRQTLDRINDSEAGVLVLNCKTVTPDDIMKHVLGWLISRFPPLKKILMANSGQLPAGYIKLITPAIAKHRLILVFDGAEALMRPDRDRQWDFADSRLRDFMIELSSIEGTVHTIITSTYRWSYLREFDAELVFDLHVGSLQVSDAVFVVQEFPHFKNLDEKRVGEFFNQVGGHPATLHMVNTRLAKNQSLLNHPSLKSALAKFWHQGFLEHIFSMLTPQEREILQIASVHRYVFNPGMVQLLADLPEIADAEAVMVAWETVSVAEFVGVDDDGTPWYIVPNLIATYIDAALDEPTRQRLHFEVADAIEHTFFVSVQNRYQAEGRDIPADADARTIVIEDMDRVFRSHSQQAVGRYLELAYTWQRHFRDAGESDTANRIVAALMPSLILYRQHGTIEELLTTILGDKQLDTVMRIKMLYWQAVMLIDQKKESIAFSLLSKVILQTGKSAALKTTYFDALEKQAEILRNRGDIVPAIEKLLDVRDYRMAVKDREGVGRVSAAFVELAYHGGELETALQGIDNVLKLMEKASEINEIRVIGQMLLIRGKIARQYGHMLEAMKNYDRALNVGHHIADVILIAQCLEAMGYTYGLMRQYDIALEKLLAAVDIYERTNDFTNLSIALTKLSVIQSFRNDTTEATGLAERALRLANDYAPANVEQTERLLKSYNRKWFR